jgi:hypothetical protein
MDAPHVADLVEVSRSLMNRDVTMIQRQTLYEYEKFFLDKVNKLMEQGYDQETAMDRSYKESQTEWGKLVIIRECTITAIKEHALKREQNIIFLLEEERESLAQTRAEYPVS